MKHNRRENFRPPNSLVGAAEHVDRVQQVHAEGDVEPELAQEIFEATGLEVTVDGQGPDQERPTRQSPAQMPSKLFPFRFEPQDE